mmetsp:Transcript_29514/g.85408  ORF Transcript_29514/g.85408 Transcript_29514/m.85408 type:complete len:80 (-) Transcript_29514:58-297(-)
MRVGERWRRPDVTDVMTWLIDLTDREPHESVCVCVDPHALTCTLLFPTGARGVSHDPLDGWMDEWTRCPSVPVASPHCV